MTEKLNGFTSYEIPPRYEEQTKELGWVLWLYLDGRSIDPFHADIYVHLSATEQDEMRPSYVFPDKETAEEVALDYLHKVHANPPDVFNVRYDPELQKHFDKTVPGSAAPTQMRLHKRSISSYDGGFIAVVSWEVRVVNCVEHTADEIVVDGKAYRSVNPGYTETEVMPWRVWERRDTRIHMLVQPYSTIILQRKRK